ncbi:MAG: YdcF family protein [Alphaproteobacteria bacterium]|nr:YdcF family protein [Alphaproteobacteria bacterium]
MTQRLSRTGGGGGGAGTVALGLALVLAGLSLGGFGRFVTLIPAAPPSALPRADAIVMLTGGDKRLDLAIALLETSHGERLLISGVNPQASRADLAALVTPDRADRFACCVDLDYVSTSTRTNAEQTARWARAHGYDSLLVVTTDFHMPRSLAELGHALPEVTLLPAPAFPDPADREAGPARLRLLVLEFGKYAASLVRMRLS